MSNDEWKDRDSYWISELRSLGIDPRKRNELNDAEELGSLADNIKKVLLVDYASAYDSED